MTPGGLVFDVGDLVDHPEKEREVEGVDDHIRIEMIDVVLNPPVTASSNLRWVVEGLLARFRAEATASFRCTRCLTEWEELVEVEANQLFGIEQDEDGYKLGPGLRIDLAGPVRDELGLALPTSPICRQDCLGLCPVCGNDLNRDPCDGHEEETDSPFAVLKDLFDS
ncbi:MAG: hypothetical protein GEU79_00870 [Acidimicrobiia bacterium]|nr:hypothetical protein [Acidimicrobiia bacterium]